MTATREYAFGPDVALRMRAPALALRHFDAEFGPVQAKSQPQVEVDLRFGRGRRLSGSRKGGHKTVAWHVATAPPDCALLRASIEIAGGPPSFALSLIQGYVVEPLVSFALARAGFVALPSAAVEVAGAAVVLMGRSRSGKSTLSVRALARGRSVLGDDQVILDRTDRCWPYPRRLRVYPDIRVTAPAAWSRLPARTRSVLIARRIVKRLSWGYVAPSLPIAPTEFQAGAPRSPMPVGRLVVIERVAGLGGLERAERDSAWAVQEARDILTDQRRAFVRLVGPQWEGYLASVVRMEEQTLNAAWARLPIQQLRVPAHWPAARAVSELEAHLGTG